jgi:hypothetical protein
MRSYALALVAAVAAMLAPAQAAAAQPVVADMFSSVRAVRVSGDTAYAVSTAGLLVYDVSDRANPRLISNLFLDRIGSFKLEISGDYAYVLSGEIVFEPAILRIIDISDPRAPRLVGEFTDLLPDSRVQALLVMGTTVALADGNAVALVDVSDPANPTLISRLPIVTDPEQIVGLAVNGSTLFAAWIGLGGEQLVGGVTSIDISDPAAPTQIDVFALEGTPTSMTSVGDTLYVGETLTAVIVVDASDPAAMAEATRIDFPLTGQVDVYAKGDRLFTGAQGEDVRINRVGVYDIGDPRAPRALGETELPCQVVGMDYDPEAQDTFMPCVGASGSGTTIYDVAPDGALAPIGSALVPEVRDVEPAGAGATLLAATDGLYAVRPGEGGTVEILGRLALEQGAYRIQVVGERAYVLAADSTIAANGHVRIVDVSDPANMSELGSLALTDLGVVYTSKRFFVEGETLYVAEPEGLVIYDASDPAALERLGTFETPDPAENVIVSDGVAYVNTLRFQDELLHVDLYAVKVRNPARPKLRGKRRDLDMANFSSDMAVRDGRLYMLVSGQGVPFGVAGDGRVLVVDVGRKKPRLVSEGPTAPSGNGYAREIRLAGDLAYVADGLDGVTVLSIAGDGAPEFVRAVDTPGFAGALWVDDQGNVAVADLSSYQVYAPDAAPE